MHEGGESLATWMPRLTEVEFERVAKVTPGGLIESPDAEGRSGEGKQLRPKHRKPDDDELLSSYLKPEDSREELRLLREGENARDVQRLHTAAFNRGKHVCHS